MNRLGQLITWSTIAAPHLFSGECTRYTTRDATQRKTEEDEAGDQMALILEGAKTEISFDAKITDASTDFLDLSGGAAITIAGINAGVVLASRAVETWRLGQAKTASITATHYPDIVQADAVAAGNALTAFTPAPALTFVYPGSKIVYGTHGLTHASGIVHGLTLEQMLTITEDDITPDGKITGAATHGYMRMLSLDLLARTDMAAKPALKSVLAITGAPAHAGGYRVESVEERYELKRGKMYAVGAVWIPPMAG